eukprot:6208299-Pleurochrysis_carterae.AAC.1
MFSVHRLIGVIDLTQARRFITKRTGAARACKCTVCLVVSSSLRQYHKQRVRTCVILLKRMHVQVNA